MAEQATPDVSVIIPAYNALPYLHRGLESLVSQTLGTDRMEIVVVDDGSTDGTGEALDEWSARYPGLFRVVHATASGGPATPRNTGLGMVRGRYVYFLDADDYLGAEALERLLTTADDEGSDIVLGKMVATSTRGVPASMYHRNDLDADLFTSRVWWTLAALKLFRRSLIDDNNLRFPTQFPNASDQPFTALAYLRARKISVLSDYDFYYVVLRDDGKHVTKSGTVSNNLDVVEAMCELIEDEVLDVEKRAPLLTRHFQIDLAVVMRGILRLPRAEQEVLLTRVIALVRRHLSAEVQRRLTPDLRVVYHLAERGLVDETLRATQQHAQPAEHSVLIEGERAYAELHHFRNKSVQVPDELFDYADRLKHESVVASFESLEGGRIVLSGTAGFLRVAGPTEVSFVLRSHEDPTVEFVLPATRLDGDGFRVEADLLAAADGQPLPEGTWDAFARVTREGVTKDCRLRGQDPVESEPDAEPNAELSNSFVWAATEEGEGWSATTYLTKTGRLRIDVKCRRGASGKQFTGWRLAWDDTDLVVRGDVVAPRSLAPLRFILRGPDGDVRRFAAEREVSELVGRVSMKDLSAGVWELRLRVGKPPAHRPVTIASDRALDPLTWRDRLNETRVVQVEGKTVTLEVSSESLTHRAGRKLRSITGR